MKYLPILIILLTCPVSAAPLNSNLLQLNYKMSVKDDLKLTWSGKFSTDNTASVTDLKYAVDYAMPIKGDTKLLYEMSGNDKDNNLKLGFGFQNENTKASFAFSQKISTDVTKPAEGVLMTLDVETRF